MRNDFWENVNPNIKEGFLKSMYGTVRLVGVKELESFSLGIDYDDADCQDLILKFHGKKDKDQNDIIYKDGYQIIKRYFNHQRENDLIDRLYSINEKYFKKNKENSTDAHTAIILLEDRQFDKARLPLLEAILHFELLVMEEEIFLDPAYFANRGKNYLHKGDLQNAEKFFLLERKVDSEHWSSYENMADTYYAKDRKEESRKQINEALKRIYKCWQEEHDYLDFEVVEEIEEKADEILDRDRSVYINRICKYAIGLIYFLGAAPLGVVLNEIKVIVNGKKTFKQEELAVELKKEPGINIDGDLLYLAGIENPRVILEEIAKRGLKQISPYPLSYLKLAQEGRVKDVFFSLNEKSENIDKDIRRLTDNELNLVSTYEELRKDITDKIHYDLLLNRFINKNKVHAQKIADIFTYIWNNFPRWEIGGQIPAASGGKISSQGIENQEEKHITAFSTYKEISPSKSKRGRNEPCPCGSGKKYKKCCGA